MSIYPQSIQKIAQVILEEVERHYPGLTKKTFDSFGFTDRPGSPAKERVEMCVYIELLKAGVNFECEKHVKLHSSIYQVGVLSHL